MRLFGFRVPFFVAVIFVGIGSTVSALGHRRTQVETVYTGPVTTTLTVPTSYVVTSSWVEPTSYVVPTATVVPTSYATAYVTDPVAVVQPTYVSTAYVRTGLFGRRWLVERPVYAGYRTGYVPSSYYLPTAYYPARTYTPTVLTDPMVWPTSYVASADCVCPDRVALDASPSRAPSGATTAPRGGTGSKTIRSEAAEESAMPSDVGPAPSERDPAAVSGTSANVGAAGNAATNKQDGSTTNDNSPTPPPVPRPTGDAEKAETKKAAPVTNANGAQGAATVKQAQPGQVGAATTKAQPNPNAANPGTPAGPPTAPGDMEIPSLDGGPPGEARRQSLRPVFPVRPLRADTRNVLTGFVQSRSAGQLEEGVRISVTNAYDQGLDKSTVTDAFGRFSVRLAEGEWTVNVTMPSGRVYSVSQIRVSNGQITDSLGRRIPSLEITR